MTTKAASISGAKVALLWNGAVLVILRDEVPGLPYAGHWDLPGGGREGTESAEACVMREIFEELGLLIAAERFIWRSVHASVVMPGTLGVFFVAEITALEIAGVVFGDEGQTWRMMPVVEFLAHEKAVPFLQERLAQALAVLG
jgi:8-oxo-dGTP diphosphatase